MLLTAVRCAVNYSIHLIFGRRLPRQVLWIYAALVAIAARMSSLMGIRRRRAMLGLTDEPANSLLPVFHLNASIPIVADDEGPLQALVTSVWENLFREVTARRLHVPLVDQGVAVSIKATIVGRAET
jgi:hypothetical protein